MESNGTRWVAWTEVADFRHNFWGFPCVPFDVEILVGLSNEAKTLLQCKRAKGLWMDTDSWHESSWCVV